MYSLAVTVFEINMHVLVGSDTVFEINMHVLVGSDTVFEINMHVLVDSELTNLFLSYGKKYEVAII